LEKSTVTNHSRHGQRYFAICLLTIVASAFTAGTATADFVGATITVEATNSDGRGTFTVNLPANPTDPYTYNNPNVVELRDSENMLIGSIDDIQVHLEGDPVASISFVATAGAFPTTFSINSAVVSFPPILNPIGNAISTVTLTDTSTNGASITPVAPNTGLFLPTYNGSTLFFPLVGPQTISSGGAVTANEGTGNQVIAGSVSSIQARFNFTLSAMDSASGVGRFEVVPEPSTIILAGAAAIIGAVSMWRRRNRVS
jgi:hypothetical protein